jgi:hypothetical protein
MRKAAFLIAASALLWAQGAVKPAWVTQLPSQPGKVYAVGLALISPTESLAIRQAGSNAKGEVIARLRASVKSTTDLNTSSTVQRSTGAATTASSTQNLRQATTVAAQAMEIPGLAVEETWTDRRDNTVYALASLDVAAAQTELQNRFNAMQADLANETASGEPRERIRKLQRLRSAQAEMAKLDDMAGLLTAGGGDPALRSDVRKLRLSVDKLLDQLQASLTFCVGGDKDLGQGLDVGGLIRNAVLKQGLGWAESNGEFTLKLAFQGSRQGVDIKAKKPWEHQYGADFIVARAIVEVTLVDRAGTQYESTTIEGKGVHVQEMMADKKLMDDFKAKLGPALEKWLKELTK